MALHVLVSDKNNPIVGEKQKDGTTKFNENSYYKPSEYITVQNLVGNLELPVFMDTPLVNHDALQWLELSEFIDNELIVKIGGYERDVFLKLMKGHTDTLDKHIHDIYMKKASELANKKGCESERSIYASNELQASRLINSEKDVKILHLLLA